MKTIDLLDNRPCFFIFLGLVAILISSSATAANLGDMPVTAEF
jgi:hypothetical protein